MKRKSPVYTYELLNVPQHRRVESVSTLEALLGERLAATEAPPEPYPGDRSWWWYGTTGRLLNAGGFLSWELLRWQRRVPASLFNARVRDAEAELEQEMERSADLARERGEPVRWAELRAWKRDTLAERKDAIHGELLTGASPGVKRTPLTVDDQRKRVVIYGGSESERDAVLLLLIGVLRRIYGDETTLAPWSASSYLAMSRRLVALPASPVERFLSWLLRHADSGRCVLALPIQGVTRCVWLGLGEQLVVRVNGGRVVLRGDAAVREYLDQVSWPDHDAHGLLEIERLELTIGLDTDPGRWLVALDNEARLRACKLNNLPKPDREDPDGDHLMVVDDYALAADVVRWLVQAWDRGPLAELIAEQPQMGLWAVEPQTAGTWITPSEASEMYPRTDDAESAAQPRLFGEE